MTTPAISKPKPTTATIRQINAAHDAVINAARDALQNAFRAGELLSSVKDGQDHGDWETWLSNNCPNISLRTARLYMSLSKKEDELMAAADQNGNTVADLSVREAQKLLAKPLTPEQKAKREAKAKEKEAAKKKAEEAKKPPASPSPASSDLKDLMQNCGADEIGKALKDADKLNEFEPALIAQMTPEKLCSVLTQAWSTDQLRDQGVQASGRANRHNVTAATSGE